MHLLVGSPQDPWCLRVRAALEARDYPTRIISNPLTAPARLTLRLDSHQSDSQFSWREDPQLFDDRIAGVLVCSTGWIDPDGWRPADLAYMHSEMQAALLAWLWSLACPVVNRYPSAIWYRPQAPLLCWQGQLRRCGLPAIETLVTNVEEETRSFRQRLTAEGATGAVYWPLTSDVRYLVSSDQDWIRIAAMQRYTPVCLTYPHEAAQLACVVGRQVVWEGEPTPEMSSFEPALRSFANATGLAFVELAFARISRGISVVAVEPYPRFERFGETARGQIVHELVRLLTTAVGYSCTSVQ